MLWQPPPLEEGGGGGGGGASLSGVSALDVSFWYHCYGSNIGSLSFEIQSPADTGSWTSLSSVCDSSSSDNVWKQKQVSTSAYSGAVRVRFKGVRGSGYPWVDGGDVAVDAVTITPLCAAGTSGTGGVAPCTPCTSGLVSVIRAATCEASCGSGECCPSGLGLNGGGAACVHCSENEIVSAGVCQACSAGSQPAAGSSICACKANFFGVNGEAPCTPCPAFSSSVAG